MKEAIKMYHLFFPRKWLVWCTYILYPVIALSMGVMLERVGFYIHIAMIFVSSFVVMAECILDMVVFRGIGARDCNTLEYVKLSGRGIYLVKQGLGVDGVRRLFSILLIMFGMWPINVWNKQYAIENGWQVPDVDVNSVTIYLQCALMIFIVNELGFFISRRYSNVLINLILVYLEFGIISFLSVLLLGGVPWVVSILLAVIAIIVAVMERKLVIHRVRESYYDEGYKKVSEVD